MTKFKYPESRDLRFERRDPNPATPFVSDVERVDGWVNAAIIVALLCIALLVML